MWRLDCCDIDSKTNFMISDIPSGNQIFNCRSFPASHVWLPEGKSSIFLQFPLTVLSSWSYYIELLRWLYRTHDTIAHSMLYDKIPVHLDQISPRFPPDFLHRKGLLWILGLQNHLAGDQTHLGWLDESSGIVGWILPIWDGGYRFRWVV